MTKRKTALIKSIAYWERMINFAKKQCSIYEPSKIYMEMIIGENWGGEYDPFCALYEENDCSDCPLAIIGERCCSSGLWDDVCDSETWGEWLIAAHEMIEVLKLILRRWQV